MQNHNFCQLWLTCKDSVEAEKISEVLLEKKLVACVKQFAINSQFHWENKIENSKEILLMMESREDLFEKVEAEVAKLHSYDTFVLSSTPLTKISKKAEKWMRESLANRVK